MKNLLFFLACLLLAFLYVKYIEKRSIFFPYRPIEVSPSDYGLEFEDINFATSDQEKLNAWFLPSPGVKKVLLFFHGNAGNISHRLEKISIFKKLGLQVFIIDYRGYGKSSGKPSENGIYLDAKAAYDYLVKEKKFSPGDILVFGESLGAQAAVDLASKEKVAAIILEGGFTSAKDMSAAIYPFLPTIFLSVKFDSLSKIAKVSCPKMIIHSRNDEIVPFRLGEKLFKASPEPKTFLAVYGGHNSSFMDSMDLFTSKIKEFISNI